MSGAYTINQNAAADCRSYLSYNDALADLLYYGVGGSVQFNVAVGSGPYTERLSIPPIQGASATNTITFNGNGEILQYSPSNLDYTIIDLNGADHIILDNIYIKGTNMAFLASVFF
jgi:trimeric autotransporter adhesin